MSQEAVRLVSDMLLTSGDVRARFARHPLGALAELQFYAGLELTADEMRAFAGVDPEMWSSNARIAPGRVH